MLGPRNSVLESAAAWAHLFASPCWRRQRLNTSLDPLQGIARLGFGVFFNDHTPKPGSCLEAGSITIGCACWEHVSGHKLHSIMRYLNAYGRRSHQGLQREVHALDALILYYTMQLIINHKVTLRTPEKCVEFCSHALKGGLHILINPVPANKQPARLTEHVLHLLTLFADFSGVFTVRSACFPFFEGVLFIFGEWNLPFNFIVNEERWERSESRKTQKCVTGLG